MDDPDVVVIATQLQRFFYRYVSNHSDLREIQNALLEYVPKGCNYVYNPLNMVAERDVWTQPTQNLKFQLSLIFTPGCRLRLDAVFYAKLSFLGEIQKIVFDLRYRPARPEPYDVPKNTNLWFLLPIFDKHTQKLKMD